MATRPKDTSSKATFAEYIAFQIDNSDKKQKEIARELEYDNPNIITMFKKGITKVPINKIPKFADVLGVDRVHLLRLALLEYSPDLWDTLQQIVGNTVTANELEIVELVRSVVGNSDPELNPEARKQFKAAAKALKTP